MPDVEQVQVWPKGGEGDMEGEEERSFNVEEGVLQVMRAQAWLNAQVHVIGWDWVDLHNAWDSVTWHRTVWRGTSLSSNSGGERSSAVSRNCTKWRYRQRI